MLDLGLFKTRYIVAVASYKFTKTDTTCSPIIRHLVDTIIVVSTGNVLYPGWNLQCMGK